MKVKRALSCISFIPLFPLFTYLRGDYKPFLSGQVIAHRFSYPVVRGVRIPQRSRSEPIPMKTFSLNYILLSLFICLGGFVNGQTLSGSLRGKIVDRSQQVPVDSVSVAVVFESGEIRRQISTSAGEFRFESLPVGRYELQFVRQGYAPFAQGGVMVTSAKEAILSISLDPILYDLEEVTLYPDRPRGAPNNEMAPVSALSFQVDEARNFAGGLDDPTRVAANFPGIIATPFISENFIAVRGNSNRGLLYQIEGIPIPNPNHFARIGSSGGTFTIFSNQVLANSDFFVGAFPAEYGNATAGVFDVQFRNGNAERREYALQFGVLGLDLAAEGPFRKGGKASYLVNVRYQTLDLVNRIISYLSLPTYHDISFKFNLPTEKFGTFTVFGIGGLSGRLKVAEEDSTLWTEDLDRFENRLLSNMGAIGVTHTALLPSGSLLKTAVLSSYSFQRDNKRYLEQNLEFTQRDLNEYTQWPITAMTSLKHSFSPRLTVKTGAHVSATYHDYRSLDYDYIDNRQETRAEAAGRTFRAEAYAQAKWQPATFLTVHGGLHGMYFDLTDSYVLEPRGGINWRISPRQTLSVGYGMHSRTEHWATYQTVEDDPGAIARPNLDLGLTRAHHFVLSYQASLSDHLRLRSEVYYQSLFNVPVEENGTYSALNLDELNQLRVMVPEGTGRNYGMDIGIERFSRHGFYYMLNTSLFNSTYTDAQGNRYSTAYNNGSTISWVQQDDTLTYDLGYKVNFLLGKEFRVGKKKGGNHLLGLNGTLSLLGGTRYTPLDLEASRLAQETVLDEAQPFTLSNDPLWILDFSFNYTRNHARYTGIWSIQIKNLFSSAVPEYREYDATLDRENLLAGASLLPIMSYKVVF